jgi:hypothetical protein
VRGAEPGNVLEVRADAVVPGPWGTTVAGDWPSVFNQRYGEVDEMTVQAWDLDPVAMTGRNQHGHRVALHPFLGVMGMPPAEPGEHSTTPPGRTAATSTARSWSPAAHSTCRWRAGSSRPATGTRRRATAKSAAPASSARWSASS